MLAIHCAQLSRFTTEPGFMVGPALVLQRQSLRQGSPHAVHHHLGHYFVMTLIVSYTRCSDFVIPERFCAPKKPIDDPAKLVWVIGSINKVSLGVIYSAGQDIQRIMKRVELFASHHELPFAELQLSRSGLSHPVPLPALLRTKTLWPATTFSHLNRAATPTTMMHFLHDKMLCISEGLRMFLRTDADRF